MKQLLRRPRTTHASLQEAIASLNQYQFEDGEMIISRYNDSGVMRQVIAIGNISKGYELFYPFGNRFQTLEDVISYITDESEHSENTASAVIAFAKQNYKKKPDGSYIVSDAGDPEPSIHTLADAIKATVSIVKGFNATIDKYTVLENRVKVLESHFDHL